MNVTYLTWGETPRSYGVFASQVVGQFCETVKYIDNDNNKYEFVSAVPLIHSGLIREKLSYNKEIFNLKIALNTENISFKRIPIFSPQNFINSHALSFKLFHIYSHKLLASHFKITKPDIVHCRSYHATYAAIKVRELLNASYKIIFDARGIWPLEVTLKRKEGVKSNNFNYLNDIEQFCLDFSDKVIGVSEPMTSYYMNKTKTEVETIYLSADSSKLNSIIRANARDERNAITYCYLGALSDDTWHKPKELSLLFKRLKELTPNSKLMIITTSPKSGFQSYFQNFSIDDVLYKSSANLDELKELLAQCDIGLMSYFIPQGEIQKTLSSSVLAVKTAEYLAAGMPMIVNKYCGGAALFLEKYNVGISYEPQNLQSLLLDDIKNLLEISPMLAMDRASTHLDYKSNAAKYMKLYNGLHKRI